MKRLAAAVLVVGMVVALSGLAAAHGRVVVVPRVIGQQMVTAYRHLHEAGLRVTIPTPIGKGSSRNSFLWTYWALRETPVAGQRVPDDSVVTLSVGCNACGGALVAPPKQPTYRVPGFVGGSAAIAYGWVRHRVLEFVPSLGPLRGGNAATLFENYRVTSQSPAPGSKLKYSTRSGRITPLSISARQIR